MGVLEGEKVEPEPSVDLRGRGRADRVHFPDHGDCREDDFFSLDFIVVYFLIFFVFIF